MSNSDVKNVYNNLCSDKEIINRYKRIEVFEDTNKGLAYHNFEHIKNVTLTVERILNELGFNEEFIYKAKIACILHDVGAIEGKTNHAYRSYEFAKDYFKKNNIKFDDIDLVLEAIKIHSDGFDTTNILALALILADKLDIKKSRISEEGKKTIGNRQYSHIEDITLNINNQVLIINFVSDGNIDLKEINEYYFTKKVFKAIETFASKLNLKFLVLLDNKEWKISID